MGASFVVAASGGGPYAVGACVEEHVVGAYVVGAYVAVASVEEAYVAVASAVVESVGEEVLEASLVD